MRISALLGLFPLVVATLTAQTTDTVGGTATTPTLANAGKANVFRVDTTVYLTNFEMYLNVPGPEVLTFYLYRHHSKDGIYTLDWTATVPVNGSGVGPAWYSAGQIVGPLVAGNHYQLGVYWPGSVTYHYKTAASGAPVSFGAWHRGTTLRSAPPPTFTTSGLDSAQYYQRLTTFPISSVLPVGTPCSGSAGVAPRLVASKVARIGGRFSLDVADATPSVPVIYIVGVGPTLTTPIPLQNCLFWLNLSRGPAITVALVVSAGGDAVLPLSVPPDGALNGARLQAQAGVFPGTTVDLTNAIELTIS